MKRLIVVCVIILAGFIFVKSAIVFFARKQLENIFIQSRVSVGCCVFNPAGRVSFFDLEIKRQGDYEIRVKEAGIRYNLFSILKASPLELYLKGPEVYVSAPGKSIQGFIHLYSGKGALIFRSVDVSGAVLDLQTSELTAKLVVSLAVDLVERSIVFLDCKMDNLEMAGVRMENAFVNLGRKSGQGDFSVSRIKYNKLNVIDIKGKIKLSPDSLKLFGVSAKALNGDLAGDLDIKIDKQVRYLVNLRCSDLDIESFVWDFNLRDKFTMTGRLNGDLKLSGLGARLEILGGNFSTLSPGGTLVIKDTKFLENMARNSRQPMDLLVESFKNYEYNKGLMGLSLEGNNVILKIGLEGKTGKRDLNVVLHDFSLGKGEQ